MNERKEKEKEKKTKMTIGFFWRRVDGGQSRHPARQDSTTLTSKRVCSLFLAEILITYAYYCTLYATGLYAHVANQLRPYWPYWQRAYV